MTSRLVSNFLKLFAKLWRRALDQGFSRFFLKGISGWYDPFLLLPPPESSSSSLHKATPRRTDGLWKQEFVSVSKHKTNKWDFLMLRFWIASLKNIFGRLKQWSRKTTDLSDPPACAKRMNGKGKGGEYGKRKKERKQKGLLGSALSEWRNFCKNAKKWLHFEGHGLGENPHFGYI